MILCTRCGICMRRGLNLPCIASCPEGETQASAVPGEAKRALSLAGVTCIQHTAHCLSARSARDLFQPPAHPCCPGNPHHWKGSVLASSSRCSSRRPPCSRLAFPTVTHGR